MTASDDRASDTANELTEPRAPMPFGERNVWASAIVTLIASIVYLIVVVPRVIEGPVDEVSWVVPMAWAIGGAFAGTILLSILGAISSEVDGAIGAAIRSSLMGRETKRNFPLHAEDVRDREIRQRGEFRTLSDMSSGLFFILILAIIDADSFWVGNAVLLIGTVGNLKGSAVKIRAYRRGF